MPHRARIAASARSNPVPRESFFQHSSSVTFCSLCSTLISKNANIIIRLTSGALA